MLFPHNLSVIYFCALVINNTYVYNIKMTNTKYIKMGKDEKDENTIY